MVRVRGVPPGVYWMHVVLMHIHIPEVCMACPMPCVLTGA